MSLPCVTKFFFANYGLPIVTPVKRAAVNCVKNKELSSIQRSARQIITRNRDATLRFKKSGKTKAIATQP